jgi:hypothetical protein
MIKLLSTTIVYLLIPSLVFGQIPQYKGNEPPVKQTDLGRVWNALNTEVGQQIISYTETTVGSIDLKHAKAFTIANAEIAFVPIKSLSKVLAALCYRQLEDGSEYLFLITYNAEKKGVSVTFPSGRMYDMKSSGVPESINPDFQFQEYDDLYNKIIINSGLIIGLLCSPVTNFYYHCCYMRFGGGFLCDPICILLHSLFAITPLLLIVYAYSYENANLEISSILFAVYYYGCLLSILP